MCHRRYLLLLLSEIVYVRLEPICHWIDLNKIADIFWTYNISCRILFNILPNLICYWSISESLHFLYFKILFIWKKPNILCDRCLSLIWIHLVIYSILLMTFKTWNNCLEKFFSLVAKRTSFLPPIMYKLTISLKTR